MEDLLLGLTSHVRKGEFGEALHETGRVKGPEARVVHAVLMRHGLDRVNLRAQLEVPRIERNMRILLGVAILGPLLGMFGTVLGLIRVFGEVGGGWAGQFTLSSGMYGSLLTTAVGLGLAIPAYLVYLHLYGKACGMLHRLERAGIEAVNIVCDHRESDRIVPFREDLESSREGRRGS